MTLNIKIFLLCPIPDDQKPINEYINLKENDFTNLMLLSKKNYFSKIFINFLIGFVLVTPLTFLFNVNSQLFLYNSFYSTSFLILNFFINLSRWSQLLKRFRSSRLFYEEGSWYDGQYWEKLSRPIVSSTAFLHTFLFVKSNNKIPSLYSFNNALYSGYLSLN